MNASTLDLPSQRLTPPRREVGRGRSLPSSRAAIGSLLVVLSGLGLTYAARRATAEPTTRFAVAAREVAPGEVLRATDVRLEIMQLSDQVAGRAFSDAGVLVGAVTVGPLGRGELIQSSLVQRGGPSLREMSFPVESSRALNGNIDPGDRIDVVATVGTSSSNANTSTVLSGLQVLSVTGDMLDAGESATIVVTVAITDPAQQVTLAEAVNTAELFLVRANDQLDPARSSEAEPNDGGQPTDTARATGSSQAPE